MSEFFIGCNIPFNVIDHRLCQAMFAALRPGYKPPTRQSLSGKYLDKTHEQLQSTMKEKLQNKIVTIQQDGWSTPSNDPVISTSVTCDGVGYFVDAQLTGAKAKTAEACQEMLTKSIAYAEETFGCHVQSVVTDNAPAMAKMREGLNHKDIPSHLRLLSTLPQSAWQRYLRYRYQLKDLRQG